MNFRTGMELSKQLIQTAHFTHKGPGAASESAIVIQKQIKILFFFKTLRTEMLKMEGKGLSILRRTMDFVHTLGCKSFIEKGTMRNKIALKVFVRHW